MRDCSRVNQWSTSKLHVRGAAAVAGILARRARKLLQDPVARAFVSAENAEHTFKVTSLMACV